MNPRIPLWLLVSVWMLAAALPAQDAAAPASRHVLRLTGELSPKETVRVFSRVAGVVAKVHFRESWFFKEGDILAEIDPAEYEIDVDEAKAKLAGAEARLAAMEAGGRQEERVRAASDVASVDAVVTSARRNLERVGGLYAKGGISRQQLDDAQREAEVAQARLVGARKSLALVAEGPRSEDKRAQRAEVDHARAELKLAELKLSYTKVRAPFRGIIGQRLVDEGTYVLAANSPQASALAVYSNATTLKAIVDIPEKEMPYVRLGYPALLSVQFAPGLTFPGTVCNLYPYVDPKTRNGRLEIEVPNDPVRLMPGMFCAAVVDCADKPARNALEILGRRKPGIGMEAARATPPMPAETGPLRQ
ncbi:MAG: efflux RND transporter periplasmic adaptor subunit [Candidatus Wallbacteria bacterium]|nr:efflux RND transporter periplasmic adaptor subunit [Candidatus Wallbacteria bacterium]